MEEIEKLKDEIEKELDMAVYEELDAGEIRSGVLEILNR